MIERAVLMTQGPQIKANDLGLTSGRGDARQLEDMSLEEVEAFLIKKALAPLRRQCAQRRGSARPEPERILPAAAALWALSAAPRPMHASCSDERAAQDRGIASPTKTGSPG